MIYKCLLKKQVSTKTKYNFFMQLKTYLKLLPLKINIGSKIDSSMLDQTWKYLPRSMLASVSPWFWMIKCMFGYVSKLRACLVTCHTLRMLICGINKCLASSPSSNFWSENEGKRESKTQTNTHWRNHIILFKKNAEAIGFLFDMEIHVSTTEAKMLSMWREKKRTPWISEDMSHVMYSWIGL